MKKNMNKENFKQVFINGLQEIYFAEKQLVDAIPKMIKAVDSPELKEAIKSHFQQTKEHVNRLKKIFNILHLKEKKEPCEAIKGLIEECKEVIAHYPKSAVRDAALISKTQCIEHYEISVYGTLRTFASELDFNDVADLLQATLNEEAKADRYLTKIAEGGFLTAGVNHKAAYEEV